MEQNQINALPTNGDNIPVNNSWRFILHALLIPGIVYALLFLFAFRFFFFMLVAYLLFAVIPLALAMSIFISSYRKKGQEAKGIIPVLVIIITNLLAVPASLYLAIAMLQRYTTGDGEELFAVAFLFVISLTTNLVAFFC